MSFLDVILNPSQHSCSETRSKCFTEAFCRPTAVAHYVSGSISESYLKDIKIFVFRQEKSNNRKLHNLKGSRGNVVWTCSLSLFCERILRFSQAKILGFFLWLSAKKLKRQSTPHFRSALQIMQLRLQFFIFSIIKFYVII